MTCERADERCTNPYEMCLVCPFAKACPTCEQPAGRSCRRPSGHNAVIHAPRLEVADREALRSHWDEVVEMLGEKSALTWEEKLIPTRELLRRRGMREWR